MKQHTLKQQLAFHLIFILHAEKRIFCRDDRKTPALIKTIFSGAFRHKFAVIVLSKIKLFVCFQAKALSYRLLNDGSPVGLFTVSLRARPKIT
ncbi:MAG: hypothetical protein U9R66_05210 [Thermodesulfobacteriota bacterium]|nr:hypothetical protein [Thermodesulfobacteriota bacterium]